MHLSEVQEIERDDHDKRHKPAIDRVLLRDRFAIRIQRRRYLKNVEVRCDCEKQCGVCKMYSETDSVVYSMILIC